MFRVLPPRHHILCPRRSNAGQCALRFTSSPRFVMLHIHSSTKVAKLAQKILSSCKKFKSCSVQRLTHYHSCPYILLVYALKAWTTLHIVLIIKSFACYNLYKWTSPGNGIKLAWKRHYCVPLPLNRWRIVSATFLRQSHTAFRKPSRGWNGFQG